MTPHFGRVRSSEKKPSAGARARSAFLLALVCTLAPAPLAAQSLMERTDNVSGGWVGNSGSMYFNFIHRFVAGEEPTRKVSNFPTFTVAAGLPARTLIGFNYSTNSLLAPGYPNEWEFFARNRPFSVESGAPLDLAVQVGYNLASDGVDGEVSIGRAIGPVHPIVAFRVLADPFEAGSTQMAVAGGAIIRVNRMIAVAGDVGTLFEDESRLAWSAGLRVALPYTPHTLSLHASNTNAATLQGLSRPDRTRWGFEFTVPLTLGRWRAAMAPPEAAPVPVAAPHVDTVFVTDTIVVHDTVVVRESTLEAPAHRDTTAAAPAPARPPATTTPTPRPQTPPARPATPTVRAADIRGLAFAPARIEIARGTTIEWTNRDQVQHTVTARDGSFNSGMIDPGAKYRRTFEEAGTYEIFCMPHPFMRLTVVVR